MVLLSRFKYTPLPFLFSTSPDNNAESSFLSGLNIQKPRTFFSYITSESILYYVFSFGLLSSIYFFLAAASSSSSLFIPSILCVSLLNFTISAVGIYALKRRSQRALMISIGYQATQLAIFSALSVLSVSLLGDMSACRLLQNLFDWNAMEYQECMDHKLLIFGIFYLIVICQILIEVFIVIQSIRVFQYYKRISPWLAIMKSQAANSAPPKV